MTGVPSIPTETAPPDERGGTYERDTTACALLWYKTHVIHDLRRDKKSISMGSDPERDVRIAGPRISRYHCWIERRARGLKLLNRRSHNGTFYETRRTFGRRLQPLFEELGVPSDGIDLRPGMTFVVGDKHHRYIAIDGAMRKHHAALLDILGTEDEVRDSPNLVSPSDFILAADSGGHMLITGKPGCGQDELADIAHKLSKRRASPFMVHDDLPRELEAQNAFLKDEVNKSTLLLRVNDDTQPFDPGFLSRLFSPSYEIRVIVLARTVAVASEALGAEYLQPLMQVALRPLAERRAAIHPLIDRWLAAHGSPLRIADLTPENQHALLVHEWRDNLVKLRETAERLDAIVRAPSLNQARKRLRIARNTFYAWFGDTLGLSDPLVSKERQPALRVALAAQPRASATEPSSEHDPDDDDDPADEA